jgi:DNA replicative helicase MCM subunit Mcm2 (Cdc46/Mcm family)
MIFSDLLICFKSLLEPRLRTLPFVSHRDSEVKIDLAEMIDRFLLVGQEILNRPIKHLQSIYQAVLYGQQSLTQASSISFTLEFKNSPLVISKLSSAQSHLNKIVTISPVFIKSISRTTSFISSSEFICKTCFESFTYFNDLSWGVPQLTPNHCFTLKNISIPKTRSFSTRFEVKQENLANDLNMTCDGLEFDMLENTKKYADYQELIVSDGKEDLSMIVQGELCNKFKVGEVVEITGIYSLKLSSLTSEYFFLGLGIEATTGSLLKSGVKSFQQSLSEKEDFEIRSVMLRSSFTNIYGNYHIKYAILLSLLARFCGEAFTCCIQGELSTGKSTLARRLVSLFPDELKLVNGAMTAKSSLSSSFIKNMDSGRTEAGLLQGDFVLVVDNFNYLNEKLVLLKAIEQRSVFILNEIDPGKKNFEESHKLMKLSSELDKFDVIVMFKNYECDQNFTRKIIGCQPFEDFDDIWDFDTIRQLLMDRVRNLKDVKIEDENVEILLQKFIQAQVSSYLKNNDMPVAAGFSVRLLESLIKLSKLNSALFNHSQVTYQDAFDAILLLKFYNEDHLFTDIKIYSIHANYLKDELEFFCGPLFD